MTALLINAAAWAQTRAAESSLPIGTPVVVIADDTVDARVRPFSTFRAHLRDPIALGDTLVAPAGTAARIVVLGKGAAADGTITYRITISAIDLGLAGTLPVKPDSPTVAKIAAGTVIPATTLATIGYEAGKVRVLVPLPFMLSTDPPTTIYTPAPLRTAGPLLNPQRGRRGRGPAPSPSPGGPAASPAPGTSSSPAAGPSASPGAAAEPAAPAGPPAPGTTNPPAGTPVFPPAPTPPGPPGRATPLPVPT